MIRPALTVLLAAALAACSAPEPKISTRDGWARATGQSDVAAAYLTIDNRGGADRLTGVRAGIGRAALHESTLDGGVIRMRPIDPAEGLVVPSNGKLVLGSGGAHVMITGLKRPLAAGDSFSLTLLFAKARPEKAVIAVLPATAAAPR